MAKPKIGKFKLPIIRRVDAVALDQNVVRLDILVPPKEVSKYFRCKTISN